jgi:hypothetical protein
MNTNEHLQAVIETIDMLIGWAEADAEHQAEQGSPGLAREDKSRAATLRKARALLDTCWR